MDFDLSEEQRLLKESVDGLLGSAYDFDSRKKYMKEKGGWSRAFWGKLAEQGLLGLPFTEADGGFGGGGVETEAELSCLRAEGCDEGQGFLFSKARPNAEIISLLAAQRGIDGVGEEDAALVA